MITYLMGAGASAKALPTVKGIPDNLQDLIEKFKSVTLLDDPRLNKLPGKPHIDGLKDDLVRDWEQILSASENCSSVDTYAKQLFLNGHKSKLWAFKNAFSAYLCYMQAINEVDIRYNDFFASILNAGISDFPSNIRVVTWNYDSQFEKSYNDFSTGGDLNCIVSKLERKLVLPGFYIYRVNGVAGYMYSGDDKAQPYSKLKKKDESILSVSPVYEKIAAEIVHTYAMCNLHQNRVRSTLSFAWEEHDFVEQVREAISATEILVIIGYSFPFFNRAVDRKLFGDLKLKKIYFQSPDAPMHSQRLLAINPSYKKIIELITDTEQFHLPVEM